MGLADLVELAVELANKTTGGQGGLQDVVLMYPWIGSDDFGADVHDTTPVELPAIVEEKQSRRELSSGDIVVQKASFLVLQPVAPNGAENRKEPLDTRDKFVLPSGYTGPVLDIAGPTNPKTHAPYMFTVILG